MLGWLRLLRRSPKAPFADAVAYSRANGGRALVILSDGVVVAEDNADAVRDIESASKTICPLIAFAMIEDGMIESLDVRVSAVITEWAGAGPKKQNCNLRRLLSQTAGLEGGQTGSNPTYQQSIFAGMTHPVGRWDYGPNSYGVFGEFAKRVLAVNATVSLENYIRSRALPPGAVLDHYDRLPDGNLHLAGGAHMSARSLAALGERLRLDANPEMITSQTVAPDPLYGLSVWMCMDRDRSKPIPDGGYAAAGANNQRLYILPGRGIVCARLGVANSTFSDAEMIRAVVN